MVGILHKVLCVCKKPPLNPRVANTNQRLLFFNTIHCGHLQRSLSPEISPSSQSPGLQAADRPAPASSSTAGAPTTTPEATLLSASTSTADGVPPAPNARPTTNCWSSTMGEFKPISLLASSVPAETTRSLGAPLGGFASHSLRSGSIFWQKPHPGFQKSTSVSLPLKSIRSTLLPARSGSSRGGAGSPTLRAAGRAGVAV